MCSSLWRNHESVGAAPPQPQNHMKALLIVPFASLGLVSCDTLKNPEFQQTLVEAAAQAATTAAIAYIQEREGGGSK